MAKRESRAAQRQRQLDEALQVAVPARTDVVVVGGGAAGLVAAITAAEDDARVVVLERDLSCGLPILATGNGRCNFANVQLDVRRFNCPEFVDAVCGPRWLDDVLEFFRYCGMRWCLEDDRLYPVSRQAASVRNVLLARAQEAGVVLAPAREVVGLTYDGSAARVTYRTSAGEESQLEAGAVVVATGGGDAGWLEGLGLPLVPSSPVLCPLACEPSPLSELDGRRAHARVMLNREGSFFPSWQERGEVLFRSYGLSGIVIFDASRRAGKGDLLELDLAPDLNQSELRMLVDQFARGDFPEGCLDGVLDPAIACVLERLARERWHIDWPERKVPASDSEALMMLVKSLPAVVVGPTDIEHAQVMRGGLATDSFDPATLAARECPWLFACGEALDVDADCGGYNLGWAWKSGMVAGKAAVERAHA